MKKNLLLVLFSLAFIAQAQEQEPQNQEQKDQLFSDQVTRAVYIGVAYARRMQEELEGLKQELNKKDQHIADLYKQIEQERMQKSNQEIGKIVILVVVDEEDNSQKTVQVIN